MQDAVNSLLLRDSMFIQITLDVFVSLDNNMRGSMASTDVYNWQTSEVRYFSVKLFRNRGLNLRDAQVVEVSLVGTNIVNLMYLGLFVLEKDQRVIETTTDLQR